MPATVILGRLCLALLLGGLVGVEREMHGRAAGFRTHILVCLGASLIMLVSTYGFPSWSDFDPGRMAAQVVSGIGFLGAGTILREGISVRGLTTAASLWVVAGIGLAVGAGFYVGAAGTALLAVITLQVLNRLEHRFIAPGNRTLEVEAVDRPGLLADLTERISSRGGDIAHIRLGAGREGNTHILVRVRKLEEASVGDLIQELRRVDGVNTVSMR